MNRKMTQLFTTVVFSIHCLQKNIRFHITSAACWEDDLVSTFFVSLRSVKARVYPGIPSTLVVTSVLVLSQHMLFQKAVSQKYVGVRVAEVVRGHGGPPPKSLVSDENFKPEHTLFCCELRFVEI